MGYTTKDSIIVAAKCLVHLPVTGVINKIPFAIPRAQKHIYD